MLDGFFLLILIRWHPRPTNINVKTKTPLHNLSNKTFYKVSKYFHFSPRPPLPMSLLWSEEEASLIIQSFWRGYKVSIDSNVSLHCFSVELCSMTHLNSIDCSIFLKAKFSQQMNLICLIPHNTRHLHICQAVMAIYFRK